MKISRSELLGEGDNDVNDQSDDLEDVLPSIREGSPSSSPSSGEEEEEEPLNQIQRKRSRSVSIPEDKASESLDKTLQQTRLADKLKGQAVSRQLVTNGL